MTVEQLLLSALTTVTGALCFVAKLLWGRSEQCEKDRYELRKEIEAVKVQNGIATGRLEAYKLCPEEECPFKEDARG